jgi:hypothetical protein
LKRRAKRAGLKRKVPPLKVKLLNAKMPLGWGSSGFSGKGALLQLVVIESGTANPVTA